MRVARRSVLGPFSLGTSYPQHFASMGDSEHKICYATEPTFHTMIAHEDLSDIASSDLAWRADAPDRCFT